MDRPQVFDFTQSAGIIIAMCVIVLCIGLFRKRLDLLFRLGLRFICGAVGIYVINQLASQSVSDLVIGMNPVTLLAGTILGFPGLALLYGIKIVSIL